VGQERTLGDMVVGKLSQVQLDLLDHSLLLDKLNLK
jgi:hypothetical protein